MAHQSTLIADNIEQYLHEHENKDLLRFITCGSVDDGKSTLIGRLLHDSKMIFEDQMAAIEKDSKRFNTTDNDFDLSLLVDGLQSEREQGITIDVAYRYFATDQRKFIIADTPGHEQYTRNMATGASTCDLAIILIDARHGVQVQTRRHSYICSLLGIKNVVVAINKMDAVGYEQSVYQNIKKDYREFAQDLTFDDVRFVPISALRGDNVVNESEAMSWYPGSTLMKLLNTVQVNHAKNDEFRLQVQYVNRPNLDFRGFAGTVVSGQVAPGDEVTALPSGKKSKVKQVVTFEGDQERAYVPQAVTLTLEDEIDISRGDMIVKSDNLPLLNTQFKTHLVWMSEEPLMPNKQYLFKFATKSTPGVVAHIDNQIDVNTLEETDAMHLNLNEIGVVDVKFTQPVACDPYKRNRPTGSFIVIDRLTNGTVGAGMIIDEIAGDAQHTSPNFSEFELEFNALVRKHFPHWNSVDISKL